MSPILTSLRLSLADFLHEWRLSLCLVLGLAAVLGPLLVLFGLKSGIIEGMREKLIADPHTLEVVVIGSYHLDPAWFATLYTDPRVAFAIPRTRSLSATIDLQGPQNRGRKALSGVEMIPSAAGDPLLNGLPAPQGKSVLLSASAAQDLAVQPGDSLSALVRRTVDGRSEVQRHSLIVAAILPESAFGRDGAFVPLDFLALTEDGRDGQDGRQQAPPLDQRAFASARIFATSLDQVGPLAESLRKGGLEVRTKANEIQTLQALDRSLSVIFALIAGLAAGGYALSLVVSLWAHVDRKRKDLALLRLVGLTPLAVLAFPLAQGALIALFGAGLSALLALAVASLINSTLSAGLGTGDMICLLRAGDVFAAAAATLVLALLASSIGGTRATRIDPAESLREV
jgi:putative ABC transport system permease protein